VRSALAIGLLALAGHLAPGASGGHAATCDPITATGARYTVRIERGHPSCATARAVLHTFIATARSPRGWTCFRGHSGNRWAAACARGSTAIVRAYPRS
jgi:hypothetical protein